MNDEDRRNLDLVGESFSRWYKAEVESYVARSKDPVGKTDEEWAAIAVRNVSQYALGRLVTQLEFVGVTREQIIAFLQKHMT
jgi:hypothetical protein